MPNCLPSLPGRSRRAATHVPCSTSRGPTSMRTGTPCTPKACGRLVLIFVSLTGSQSSRDRNMLEVDKKGGP